MIAEALSQLSEQAVRAAEPQVVEIHGQKFTTRTIQRVAKDFVADPSAVVHTTLSSLVDYILDDPDGMEEGAFVSVLGPTKVEVRTPVQGEQQARKTYARAVAELPTHRFGQWLPLDEMSIYLRTCFVESEQRERVSGFVGGVIADAKVETDDDGVTQRTTVRSGISFRAEGEVPGLVTLAPYSTFHDVEQVERPFVLRLDDKRGSQVVAALFEADGGAWKHEANTRIADYIEDAVELKVYA